MVAAAPVFDDKENVVGALLVRVYAPFQLGVFASREAELLTGPLGLLFLVGGIFGVSVGMFIARGYIARLKSISAAADAWGHGEYSAIAIGGVNDERGQLAHRLNSMAAELRELFTLRQDLALAGERNRLARDLHDTVKQHIFALAMQVGAAKELLDRDPDGVRNRLADAEKLSSQIQHELVGIIKELQPSAGEGKRFEQVLRETVADWSQHSGFASEVVCDGALTLTPQGEHAFLRIAQEALANVMRHSEGTGVLVRTAREADGRVTLSITDDGGGLRPFGTAGMGLRNMRERAESLPGGWFKVENRNGKGVNVSAGYNPGVTE